MVSAQPARLEVAPAARGTPPRLLPDPVSLVLLLAVLAPVGIVFSQITFWHRFIQPWPAFLAGALCCGLASMNRRPGWLVVATSVLGLLATTLTLYSVLPGPTYALRDEQLREHMRLWIEQLLSGRQVYDDLAVILWSSLVAWTAGMWAAWTALRVGWHWLVLASAGALLVSSIGYLPHWPATGLGVYVFAALLFLARQNHRQLVARAATRGDTRRTAGAGPWAIYLAAVGAGALGLVAVGWLTPAIHWQARSLLREPTLALGRGPQFFRAGSERSVLHDFGPTLPFSGPISLGDALVASVEAPAPGYLFGVAYDRYESSGWKSTAVDQLRQHRQSSNEAAGTPGTTVFADLPDQLVRQSANKVVASTDAARGRLDLRLSGGPAYQDSESVDLTVRTQRPATVLLAAGPPVGVATANGGPPMTDQTLVSPKGLRGTPVNELTEIDVTSALPVGVAYTSLGLVSSAVPDALRRSDGTLPEWVKSSYLQLPRTLPGRVRALAVELTRNAMTDFDRTVAIQSYLRNLPYDQSITAPPANEDGVDYLLFVTGRGYCDYFASAMAVMLRSVGVPARVVAGYVMHEAGADGRYQVRENDAHAWTEVFFSGYGWQRFDATPGGAATFGGAALSASSGAVSLGPSTSTDRGTDSTTPDSVSTSSIRKGAASTANAQTVAGGRRPVLTMLWFSLAGMLSVATVCLWVRSQRDRKRAAISAWRWTTIAARLLGRGQRPHETPAEYAHALAGDASLSSPLRDLASVYGRARYGRPHAEMPHSSVSWRRSVTAVRKLLQEKVRYR